MNKKPALGAKTATSKGSALTPQDVIKNRYEAAELAVAALQKTHGDDAIFHGNKTVELERFSMGTLGGDIASGGGIPRGRIIEIYGAESSGKTTLALHVIREVQRQGYPVAFIDVEHALSPDWAAKIGVNTDDLYISQPDTGEQALKLVESLVQSNAFGLVVVDSVAALVPKAELEGEMGDSHVALQARLMSQALRKLTGVVSSSNCVLLFINQIRENVNMMGYGEKTTTPGGKALKFYASVRIKVGVIQKLKVGNESVGNRVKITVVKNKTATPFREAEFDLMFNPPGIALLGEIVDYGVALGLIEKRGAFFRYKDTLMGQGRTHAQKFLSENPEQCFAIHNEILVKKELSPLAEMPIYNKSSDDGDTSGVSVSTDSGFQVDTDTGEILDDE